MEMNKFVLRNKNLFRAIAEDDGEEICRLIDFGADVNTEFTIDELVNGKHLDDEVINILTNGKSTVKNLRESNSIDESIADILVGYEEVICLPIKANNIILSTQSKLSALQLAVLYGSKRAIIELIKKGSNPNKVLDIQGITILQLMCTAAVFKAYEYFVFDEEIIQLLFDHGADPNLKDETGRTFLHYAMFSGDFLDDNAPHTVDYYKRIQKFFINGANPIVMDRREPSERLEDIVKHEKYRNVRKELIDLLLDSGCLSKMHDKQIAGVMLAVPRRKCSIPEMYGNTVQRKPRGQVQVIVNDPVEMYNERVEKNMKLINAITSNKKDEINILLNEGISPNTRDSLGRSLLHIAVDVCDLDVIELLLDKGADPNIKTWHGGETPLIIAARFRDSEVATLLLKRGAKSNLISANGHSALYVSFYNLNGVSLKNLLLHHAADRDISREVVSLFNLIHSLIVLRSADGLIDDCLRPLKNIVQFLKSTNTHVEYLFYTAIRKAEMNNKKKLAGRLEELLHELTAPKS